MDEDDDENSRYDHTASESEDEEWVDELEPNDSASASAEYHPRSRGARESSRAAPRNPSRQHSKPRQRQPQRYGGHPHYAAAPAPSAPVPGSEHMQTMSSESTSDYYHQFGGQPAGAHYYDRRAAYPHSGVGGGYGAAPSHHAPPYAGPMVPWGPQNPFQPHGQGGGFNPYYDRGHEVMPYQQPPGSFYGGAGPVGPYNHGIPPHLAGMLYQPAPPPPPTEIARGPTPGPVEEKKPDPELERVKLQLEALQLERQKADEAQKRAEAERKIREDAEREFKARMEAMELARQEAQKEIELAKIAAEQAARERMEEERKAEEERKRAEAEMRAQVAREERDRIAKEEEEKAARAKAHAEALEKADRDARDRYEKLRLEEEERKLNLEKEKAAFEAEIRNKTAAELKEAEEKVKAAAAAAAEEAARKEVLEKEAKMKAIQEYEEKLAADKKVEEEKANAAAAAKLAHENEFKLKEEERKKAEAEAAAAAEAAAKAEEEKKQRIIAEARDKLISGVEDGREPVKFKDAVGRKFTFPFRLACKWEVSTSPSTSNPPPFLFSHLQETDPASCVALLTLSSVSAKTMEELINQAFAHIDEVGPHVRAGHYDIEGPEGELILKNIWHTTIQPGWQITMKMWPNLELHAVRGGDPRAGGGGAGGFPRGIPVPPDVPPHMRAAWAQRYLANRQAQQQQHAAGGGHHGHRGGAPMPPPGATGMRMPQMPPMAGAGRPQVPPGFPMFPGPRTQGVAAEVDVVNEERRHNKKSSKRKKEFVGWLGGKTSGGKSR